MLKIKDMIGRIIGLDDIFVHRDFLNETVK
jgi:hypothetical protein